VKSEEGSLPAGGAESSDREVSPFTLHSSPFASREGQTFSGASLLVRYINFVKLPHTLFALPFTLLGVLAASRIAPVTLRAIVLVVIAFSSARWVAMGYNRIADREFDAKNPRTAGRELPRGALSLG
jgi:4-hydroxybenzoate polyprenyltransferase